MMKIRENHEIIIEKYPYAESLNKELLLESQTPGNDTNILYTNIVGKKLHPSHLPDAPSKKIESWVYNILQNTYNYSNTQNILYKIDMWFAQYNKGHYTKSHYHIPFAMFSFVYFVNCPKGSSPLMFTTSGKRIKPEEGKVAIFPGNVKHHVPKNNCENRLTLVGNVMAHPTDWSSKQVLTS